jgi:hypothetical protein
MFRIGGSATGITSGLDQPRKQYAEGTPYDRALEIAKRGQADLAKFRGEQSGFMPSGLPGFLTSFGLNLLSQSPTGGLLSTAATAAKEPFQTFQAAQLAKAQRRADTAEDLFSTALASEYSLEEEKLKGASGGETFEKEKRVNMLNALYEGKIAAKTKELENASPQERSNIQNQIDNLKRIQDDYVESILTGKMTNDEFIKDIIVAGIDEGLFDINAIAKQYPELAPLLSEEARTGGKEGGRMGYQIGGQTAMMPEVAKADEDTVQDLSFNELRSRLPQSIGNDIVQVLANSKQALLDFANIRDQQDVDEFNQRYNVSLTIPQEG